MKTQTEWWVPGAGSWGKEGSVSLRVQGFSCARGIHSEIYEEHCITQVTTLYYITFAKRVNLRYSQQKKSNCEMMDMLHSLVVVIISQCGHISKHRVVHLQYMQFLFVSYTSIKLEVKKRKNMCFFSPLTVSREPVSSRGSRFVSIGNCPRYTNLHLIQHSAMNTKY